MFRTPLARRPLMAWVVTAVIGRSSWVGPLGAEALHLFFKQLGRPARAVGRRHTRLVEAADEARQIVDARGEGTLDRIAQKILIVVRLAIARLVRIEIRLVHHLPPWRTRSLMRSRTGTKSYAGKHSVRNTPQADRSSSTFTSASFDAGNR